VSAALLTKPTPDAVAAYARKLIAQAGKARKRIGAKGDPEHDPEALHDFRVAVRRLRSHLRAYRGCHGVGRKTERRLRDLAATTSGGRDAEVALEWLEEACKALNGPKAAGCGWLMAELTRERDAAYASVGADFGERWDVLAAHLRRRLAKPPEPGTSHPAYAAAALARIREHEAALKARLARVHTLDDQEPAHRARIEAKRLRYLVEPLRGAVSGTAKVVRGFAAFQDTLGIMHDRQVMIGHLESALRHVAAERAERLLARVVADPLNAAGLGPAGTAHPDEAGLLALAALAARERAERFAELRERYLTDGGATLLGPLDGLCAALREAAGG